MTRHERPLVKKDKDGKNITNPNGIKVNQHVIPCKHLLEWSKDEKTVLVYDIRNDEQKKLAASNSYFCVMRLWDEWTESVMLKDSEDNYQKELDVYKAEGVFKNNSWLTDYYVLLCARIMVAYMERPNEETVLINVQPHFDKEELEKNELEMAGSCHVVKTTDSEESQHMNRQVVKACINMFFLRQCEWLKNIQWVVLESDGDDFILSDAIYNNFSNGFHFFPICRRKVLITSCTLERLNEINAPSGTASQELVFQINEMMKNNAVKYYVE